MDINNIVNFLNSLHCACQVNDDHMYTHSLVIHKDGSGRIERSSLVNSPTTKVYAFDSVEELLGLVNAWLLVHNSLEEYTI